jgi:hypothetical protein
MFGENYRKVGFSAVEKIKDCILAQANEEVELLKYK